MNANDLSVLIRAIVQSGYAHPTRVRDRRLNIVHALDHQPCVDQKMVGYAFSA